jgi:hypothetical protein
VSFCSARSVSKIVISEKVSFKVDLARSTFSLVAFSSWSIYPLIKKVRNKMNIRKNAAMKIAVIIKNVLVRKFISINIPNSKNEPGNPTISLRIIA